MSRSLDIVVLGLSLSSAWGNGHATTYRSLLRALARRGHNILFLERSVPWYESSRDLPDPDYAVLRYYGNVADLELHRGAVQGADVVIVGSYVPDGMEVANWVFDVASGIVVFYDIDTPVTLSELERGTCTYISPEQVPLYDVYLSFTGGPLLDRLKRHWGAEKPVALYCSADPEIYVRRAAPRRWALGYLGTYSPDRQTALERLLIEPARRAPELSFVVAGAQYPASIDWPDNVVRIEHVPPSEHADFYASVGWMLNLTRSDMRAAGYSPSVRLFEAGACGTPVVTDAWPGLECFFDPQGDIVVARDGDDVLAALHRPDAVRERVAERARAKVLAAHTSAHRAAELEALLLETAPAAQPTNAPVREQGSLL
jgi:spore maturation protein CgeB